MNKKTFIDVVLLIVASLALGAILGLRVAIQIFEFPISLPINEAIFLGLLLLVACLGLFYRRLK